MFCEKSAAYPPVLTQKVSELPHFFDCCAFVIVCQDVVVGNALSSHYRRSYLAQAYAVPPAVAVEDEGRGVTILVKLWCVNGKGGTIQVSLAQSLADFQLFADGKRALFAYNFKQGDASALAPLKGFE